MNLDDVLERGLAGAGEDYDVPAGGIDRIREQLAPSCADQPQDGVRRRTLRGWRPSGNAWLGIAAALIVVLIAVPIAIGGSSSSNSNSGGEGGAGRATAVGAPSGGVAEPGVGGGTSAGTSGSGAEKSAGSSGHVPVLSAVPAPAGPGVVADQSAPQYATSASGSTASGDAAQRGVDPVPVTTSRVEKTGELDLQVSKGQVSATLSRLSDIARLQRGYVSDSSTQEAGSAPSGEVTLRVPVDRFEQAVHDARSIAGTKVLSLQTSGVDVTSKYVDLQARIHSLQATRSTFLTILAKATTIGETLAVQQRVTDVQTQIEQLQGQLRVLASTTSMSTLTVTVDQKRPVIVVNKPHRDNGFVKAVKLSVSRFVRGIEAIVGIIGPVVLVLMIIVLCWLAARFGYRATRRHLV
ncbi:MAG TPA: DUF4349 domain-containing protein [Mycobacteriales bacterium]|jgi:hypothetical protein|nr:DUF4349 domain-containing protein [Mycobacteriales bacterium]